MNASTSQVDDGMLLSGSKGSFPDLEKGFIWILLTRRLEVGAKTVINGSDTYIVEAESSQVFSYGATLIRSISRLPPSIDFFCLIKHYL